jgi:hypothetical protein
MRRPHPDKLNKQAELVMKMAAFGLENPLDDRGSALQPTIEEPAARVAFDSSEKLRIEPWIEF